MLRWIMSAALVATITLSLATSAPAQFGIGFGTGLGGYGPGYGGYVPGYGSGISLSVGPGIGYRSSYGYGGYGVGSLYGPNYGVYRPYAGYRPVAPSGYGVGYSYLGRPVFTPPVVRRGIIVRRRF